MHIPNYMLHVCLLFSPLSNHGDHTFECTGAGTRMLYLAVYKSNFSQIYDFCSQVISPNPQTGHNSRPLYVIPALFSNLRAVALDSCQGSYKGKSSIFSAAHFLFSSFFIHYMKKKKKKPQATFITPSLNYTIVIKQHTFNHSLC